MPVYFGDVHNFTTRTDNQVVELVAGTDEELTIKELRTEKVYHSVYSDTLGLNELTLEDTLQHTTTGTLRAQGTSVSITEASGDTYAIAGCPVPGTSLGGVAAYKNLVEYTALTQSTFTNFAVNGKYSDINEDGDLITFTDNANNSSFINCYSRSGAVWSDTDVINGRAVSISGPLTGCYAITRVSSNKIEINLFASTFWTQQQILETSITGSEVSAVSMYGTDTCVYSSDVSTKVHTRTGTIWTLIQTIGLTGMTRADIFGNVMCLSGSNELNIYERASTSVDELFGLCVTVPITGVLGCATNGVYVFAVTSTDVYVYRKFGANWIQSINTTSSTLISSVACSASKVVIGRPTAETFGNIIIYDILEYTNHLEDTNKIVFNGTDLALTSIYGNITFDPAITVVPGAFADGTESLPSITFTDETDTGVYRKAASTIGITTNASDVCVFNDTQSTFTDGTVSLPGVSFISDPNTGLYNVSADTMGITCNGVNSATFTEDLMTVPAIIAGNSFAQVTGVSTNQSLSDTVVTLLNAYWDQTPTITGDTASTRPTYAGGLFTIKMAGKYYISYSIQFTASSVMDRQSFILAGGIEYAVLKQRGATGRAFYTGSAIVDLIVNDTVQINAWQNSGGSLNTDATDFHYFQLYRL